MSKIVEDYENCIDRISPEALHDLVRGLGATAEEMGVVADEAQVVLRLEFDDADLVLVVGVQHKNFQDEEDEN